MDSSETAAQLQSVLCGYFSAPIAELLISTSLARAGLSPERLDTAELGSAVRALTSALPAFLSEQAGCSSCIRKLEAMIPDGPGEGAAHHELPVQSAEDVVRVSEVAREFAAQLGFPKVVQTKIATAVAELARNLQLYARGGRVHIRPFGEPARGIEIRAIDEGPGIPNLEVILGGTYRSRTGMGLGLRGARRLMDTFEISTSPQGTSITSRRYL